MYNINKLKQSIFTNCLNPNGNRQNKKVVIYKVDNHHFIMEVVYFLGFRFWKFGIFWKIGWENKIQYHIQKEQFKEFYDIAKSL